MIDRNFISNVCRKVFVNEDLVVKCLNEEVTDTGHQCYIPAFASKYTFSPKGRGHCEQYPRSSWSSSLEMIPLDRMICNHDGSTCRFVVNMIVVAYRLRALCAVLLRFSTAWPRLEGTDRSFVMKMYRRWLGEAPRV